MDDLIQRQAVLDYIHRILNQGTGKKKSFEFIQKYVEQLPSVNPQLMMRDATPEEQKSVDDYIKSISKPTGVNFWDLADREYISRILKRMWNWRSKNTTSIDKVAMEMILRGELPSVDIPPEHDGCKDCKYETYPEYYYPCCECKQNYEDEWQKKPHWIEVDDMIYKCSECGYDDIVGKCNFCPNCGAKMD